MANSARRHRNICDPATQPSSIELTRVADVIESCRDHVEDLIKLADVASKVLSRCYEYEENDPHLGQCCNLVRRVLEQTRSALRMRGVVSHDLEVQLHAAALMAQNCERERQSLICAMHVVRSMNVILGRIEPNRAHEVLLALLAIGKGIAVLVDALQKVTKKLVLVGRSEASTATLISPPSTRQIH